MKLLRNTTLLFVFILSLNVQAAYAGEWKFPLYISYTSGISDVADVYEDTMENDPNNNYEYESIFEWPIAVGFHPYYEFDFGLRVGGGMGPYSMIIGGDEDYICLPTYLFVGYTLIPKVSVSPYIKAGVAYPLASGGYVESRSPGFIGAVGIEFMRNRAVSMAFEFAVDNSEVELTTYSSTGEEGSVKVNPVDVIFSGIVIF